MRFLFILRHAKSSWDNARLADHDRPLNERGLRDAPYMGQLLRREGLIPDLIITSTAERALRTAEMVALACGYDRDLQINRHFYLAGPETYLATLRHLAPEVQSVMVVGHNPGLEELLERLTGRSEAMPTAALAHLSFPIEHWADLRGNGSGRLQNFWLPQRLP